MRVVLYNTISLNGYPNVFHWINLLLQDGSCLSRSSRTSVIRTGWDKPKTFGWIIMKKYIVTPPLAASTNKNLVMRCYIIFVPL